MEKAVAERLILENHMDLFSKESSQEDRKNGGLNCELTMPRGYHFLFLPYALVVRKDLETSKDLISNMNER